MSETQLSLSSNIENNSENDKENSLLGKSGGNIISEEESSTITKQDVVNSYVNT